jgi:hypothetical protein
MDHYTTIGANVIPVSNKTKEQRGWNYDLLLAERMEGIK